jgi:hypothetical protein
MSTIVTRAGKGSALTWTEGDANITNLNNDKLENIVEDTTPQLGGNLDVNGNSIVSTANADITIAPNGTGDVHLVTDALRIGDLNTEARISTYGTGNLVLTTNEGNDPDPTITIGNGANADITLTPSGTGIVAIVSDLEVGYGTGTAAITSAGAYDLDLVTNSGTNSGLIRIVDGANGNIELTPNGTGVVTVSSDFSVTGSIKSGTNSPVVIAPDGTGDVHLNTDSVRIGDNNADATIATRGTGDLILTTNEGSGVEGIIRIYDGANGNITVTPNGTGIVVSDKSVQLQATSELRFADTDSSNYVGFKAPGTVSANKIWTLPATDGTSGQLLSTNGSGVLSWATDASGGGSTAAGIAIISGTLTFQEFTGLRSAGIAETTMPHTWTESSDPSGLVTVSTNTITITNAGTYLLEYTSNWNPYWYGLGAAANCKTPEPTFKIYNSSDSTTLATTKLGNMLVPIGNGVNGEWKEAPITMRVVVTIASSKSFTIRYAIPQAAASWTDLKFVYTNEGNLPSMKIIKLA